MIKGTILAALCMAAIGAAGAQEPPTEAQAEPPASPPPEARSGPADAAEVALARGECRAAAEGYAQTAESTRDAAVARRASEVARTCEHWPARERAAERWRTLAPRDPAALREVAFTALGRHKLGAARAGFKSLFSLPAIDADAVIEELLPAAVEEAGPYPAVQALAGSVALSRLAPATLVSLGERSFEAFDFSRARSLASDALARDRDHAAAHALIARSHAVVGDATRALESARIAARLDAESQRFVIADTLAQLDRIEETRQELERLRGVEELRGEAERRLALLAFSSGDLEEAQRRFAARLEEGEGGGEALYYLGLVAERRGETEQALRIYEVLSQSGLGEIARPRAAAILMERGERTEAMTLLDDHIQENPGSAVDFTLAKAHILADNGEAAQGIALLETALDRYPAHPKILYEHAVLLERAGRTPAAVAALEKVLRSRPDDPVVLNALGYTLADHGLDLRRAERLIRQALEATPDHPAVLDSLGWARFKRGDLAQAREHLGRAYLISGDPEIAAHLGEVLWSAGEQGEARRIWAQALARHPDAEPLKETLRRFTSAP